MRNISEKTLPLAIHTCFIQLTNEQRAKQFPAFWKLERKKRPRETGKENNSVVGAALSTRIGPVFQNGGII